MTMTFDQWFEQKHGQTFEQAHMRGDQLIHASLHALTVALREYTSEMVAGAVPSPGPDLTRCTRTLREAGVAYPRTCEVCGLGPCRRKP